MRVSHWLRFSEYWSFHKGIPPDEQLFIESCLAAAGPHFVGFDVGANIGIFSCFLAAHGSAEVHAFEPVPETFSRLRANLVANGLLERCRLNCLAVGAENCLAPFRVQADSAATNRLHVGSEVFDAPGASLRMAQVTRLDDYCSTAGIGHIDFLKIDVEGMEPYVLEGAQRLFQERRVASVLLEVCPGNLRSIGLTPADLYAQLERARYSPYALKPDGDPGPRLSLADFQAVSLMNVILLPDA